jgi:hypothetical protein
VKVSADATVSCRTPERGCPGEAFADLAAAVAAGADCIDGVGQACGDRKHAFGPSASTTTCGAWSTPASTPSTCPPSGRPALRPGEWLHIDLDAAITIDHSDDQELAAPTWKKTFGPHCPFAFLDRPRIADGESLAALLRAGNAGSTPPPTTSRCCGGRWGRYRRTGSPSPNAVPGPRSWCAATPPNPPTPSPSTAARSG